MIGLNFHQQSLVHVAVLVAVVVVVIIIVVMTRSLALHPWPKWHHVNRAKSKLLSYL